MAHRLGVVAVAEVFALTGMLALASCSRDSPVRPQPTFGGVYTMTNATGGNAVVAFRRAETGALTALGSFATGGTGTGGGVDPLQSQYALVLDETHRFLFVVNAGSDDVSVFRVGMDASLALVDRVASGGDFPVSLAVRDNRLLVLNAGDHVVARFRVLTDGHLTPDGSQALAPGAAGGSTIAFDSRGERVIVTERDANRIETIAVDGTTLGMPVVTPSSGAIPFGFDVDASDHVFVSEALGATPNGSVSSYLATATGALDTISTAVDAGGGATCWLVASDAGFVFVTNTSSHTVASMSVSTSGEVTLLDATAAVTGPGTSPIDLEFSSDQKLLFVLQGGSGNIRTLAVDGAILTDRGTTPAGTGASGMQGIAVF